MDIEGGSRAASASSLAPFEEGVAEFYDSLLVPILFEPYASEMAIVAERLKPGSILEVAAGTGALTRALRVTLDPATEIVATDLSQAMIDVGAPSLTMSRTHWMHADAQNLPFAPSMFDLVVCQFGVMFFPDKLKAYDEAKRVLRSGGRLLFTTWDSLPANDFARCVDECLASLFPSNPPNFLRNLSYSYFDIASIKAQMSSAGFDAISCDRIELTSVAAAHDIAAAFCQGTPLREEIESRAPARISEIVDEVAEQMESRHGVRPCGGMSAFVVVGRAS
ncbi:methyltransferase domain-containing protein [Rhizobium leguminosarum bv. viciae]|uniref:class I SAM-dependent methyltransferase n=1 Tax=Rhizobium ruizarguesonis TaxID=2081791 RepID=UPI00102F6E98|nr:methyltransferase domain-containing protein [Rhizobium ruizarguesonis]NKJ73565.1 methyltransferase domain-containing protein [Rhizobium leguminosarum bv. viciae]NKQ74591.1 ubiquinone biosynthesis methyltransferase UbiE [Rhizobium ruizarguesonis]NKQ81963.1 ubiquinone biosynthesis methyltransferase UbiE [Rhizobium ruizarguesonis]TAZ97751.1 methyltransferase domain-containing protein [Rhizobium ruizarguesonis]TBA40648.1 methyltransferase domain-containing protein [Rhizobium ruizarguesonis]